MPKGTALSRAIRYFQEAELEEVQYVLMRGSQIVGDRTGESKAAGHGGGVKKRKPRAKRQRVNGAEFMDTLAQMVQEQEQ